MSPCWDPSLLQFHAGLPGCAVMEKGVVAAGCSCCQWIWLLLRISGKGSAWAMGCMMRLWSVIRVLLINGLCSK